MRDAAVKIPQLRETTFDRLPLNCRRSRVATKRKSHEEDAFGRDACPGSCAFATMPAGAQGTTGAESGGGQGTSSSPSLQQKSGVSSDRMPAKKVKMTKKKKAPK
jgi:hypothetical protein